LFAVLVAWISAAAPVLAEDDPACQMIRSVGASFLERCGDKLNSFSLSLSDISRSVGNDLHGRFAFVCGPIELMCEGKPEILGWFLDLKRWKQGGQDEPAIAELLLERMWHPGQSVPASSCGIVEVKVADMPGRAVCHEFPDVSFSAIVIVAADDRTGFVLIFGQRDVDWSSLRDKALQTLPRFEVQRATGDAGLLRWMRMR